jgi:hypothetical protein
MYGGLKVIARPCVRSAMPVLAIAGALPFAVQ